MPFYPKRRKGRAPRRAPRRYGRKKTYAKKLSKPMVKAVQKLIHKDVETKQAYNTNNTISFNSGITANTDIQVLVPSIAQGNTDNSRIGDQIRGQRLNIKGAIVYNPSVGAYGTYANARLACRMMVVQPRYLSDIVSIQNSFATWSAALLKKGGTTSAFTGTLPDLWAPINTDLIIKYYDRVFYLNGVSQASAVGSVQLLGSTKFFNINLKMRNKLLKYDSTINSGLTPTNYNPILLIGYAHMDGSAPDTLSTAVQMTYDTIFSYEDA